MSSEFYESLPTKRMAAGCIFLDEAGRVLLLKPVYKSVWDIPGGVVEEDESPKAAAEREVHEEIGLTITAGRLLILDYNRYADDPHRTEMLTFFFDGGTLSSEQIKAIKPGVDEIAGFDFFTKDALPDAMRPGTRRRVQIALEEIERGTMAYLEHQERV